MSNRLENEVAIVTGACSGIGRSIAEEFSKEGAKVAVLDVQTDLFDDIEAELEGPALTVECDVTDSQMVAEAVDSVVAEWGRIDVVVNNAGIVTRDEITTVTDEDMELVMDIDVLGVLRVARETIPELQQTEGSMINISSAAAEGGVPNRCSYSAAKGGVSSLTRQLAVEYGPSGVRVNALAPSVVETPANEDLREDPEYIEFVESEVPMGRVATPDEISSPTVFLASDESSFISGQVLRVDGAWGAK